MPKNLYEYVRTDEFKKWFGDWENNPNSASKVIDENGEPMLVFHGTEKSFQDFDNKELRFNYFYFAKKEGYASRFGKNVKGCFLNARKIKDAKEAGVVKISVRYDCIAGNFGRSWNLYSDIQGNESLDNLYMNMLFLML